MANKQLWWNMFHFRTIWKHTGTLSVERFIYYCSRDNWKLNLSLKLLNYTIQKLFSPNKLYKIELEWSLNLKRVISSSKIVWYLFYSWLAHIHSGCEFQELPVSIKSHNCFLYGLFRSLLPAMKQRIQFRLGTLSSQPFKCGENI